MNSIKDKLLGALGNAGVFVWMLLLFVVSALPLAFIDVPFIVAVLILCAVQLFYPLAIPLWIWGLVCAILGPQYWLSVVYYIIFGIAALPAVFSLVVSFIRR